MLERTASYIHMADGTKEDYDIIFDNAAANPIPVADNVLALLTAMKGHNGGNKIDRYQHSLQVATRAFNDGADEEMVCIALLHDIGDLHAPGNHSAFAAAVLRPYISEDNHWLVLHHGLFQGYYYMHHRGGDRDDRERFRDHPCYQATVDFCENWDQKSFDPDYETMPLSAFEPMVRRLFASQNDSFV